MSDFPLLTLKEAAEVLGITAGRIRRSANEDGPLARHLGVHKLTGGRDWMIPRGNLNAEVERRTHARSLDERLR